jgi:DNA-nicking Smr family endonuclease
VRVIHGKGRRSPNGEPVLKRRVIGWLAQRGDVLAFCEARPEHGGSGAMVVLLKAGPRP